MVRIVFKFIAQSTEISVGDCLNQLRHLSPFVISVDGLLSVEAAETLKFLSSRLTTKWKQQYSRTCGCVNSRVSITMAGETQRFIPVSWVIAYNISVQRPQWEDSAGLPLYWQYRREKKKAIIASLFIDVAPARLWGFPLLVPKTKSGT